MTKKLETYMLTVDGDAVKVWTSQGPVHTITSLEDFRDWANAEANRVGVSVEALALVYSTTMDFPEDETKDRKTLQLVKQLKAER